MSHKNTVDNYCELVKSVVVDDLSNIMKRFWEAETVHEPKQFNSKEVMYCENIFTVLIIEKRMVEKIKYLIKKVDLYNWMNHMKRLIKD